MKTPEEIKKVLECHANHRQCLADCMYKNNENVFSHSCIKSMIKDAYAYINLLEERIRGMQLQMMGDCGVCKHRDDTERCITCLFDKDHSHPMWEYEGFPTDMEKEG